MSTVQPLPTGQQTSIGLCQALIRGRIVASRRTKFQDGPRHVTVLLMPSPDEWIAPARVELVSKESLGDVGESWSGKVTVGGRGRVFEQLDPKTGETKNIPSANNSLTVCE